MALKKKITKEAFNALSEALKAEYKADGDNYVLDLDGDDDTGELRRANDRIKEEKKAEKKRADDAEAKLAALGDDTARKAGDVVTLENSWKEKLKAETDTRDAVIAKQRQHITGQLVDAVAADIAGKLSDSPKLLIPHIKARLSADFEGDSPQTRVLDAAGKISAFTPDDLQKEFAANKDFSAIIRVSKASGGAAKPGSQYTSGGRSQENNQDQNLNTASPSQLRDRVEARIQADKNNQ